ncbi:TIGR00730 family Rossman fold protein [Streptomyces sp. NRRL B-24484]|uniref:LOG family protein n=1 Tax=Streptomyces sp. NRRL B-24484 TaxID=1463833 RepID=UPI0004C12820|nr:TIGR00730 family Rossman fold protein [Streptomyces sp. NRRL B-24484]
MTGFRRVGVFCGARSARQEYLDLARETGRWLGRRRVGLVYGGGGTGLMGAVAEGALLAGSYVTGVVPHHLLSLEGRQPPGVELMVVATMHERKALMYQLSDAFVVLPGGLGTADELMEIATWAKLGLHSKPVFVVNHGGFFDGLLAWLDVAVGERMMTAGDRSLIRDVPSLHALDGCFSPDVPVPVAGLAPGVPG